MEEFERAQSLREEFLHDFDRQFAKRELSSEEGTELRNLQRQLEDDLEDDLDSPPDTLDRLARLAMSASGHESFWGELLDRIEQKSSALLVYPVVQVAQRDANALIRRAIQYVRTRQIETADELEQTTKALGIISDESHQDLRHEIDALKPKLERINQLMNERSRHEQNANVFDELDAFGVTRTGYTNFYDAPRYPVQVSGRNRQDLPQPSL